ncbi:hypothetical protein BJF79_41855 [Actinomadura sp. CNU-125]|uniref:DoxX family membrane protein n=1 Tax=Actinomadura sp. CNU-125 TaxID=1904961 RepID=UPI000961711F|nr:DoxX family membrane protein [Actinomadura sp. CNU-125]OLT28093.1 hypothetical protein BJF79_41855 [Actinomadura sp. CNU-125]
MRFLARAHQMPVRLIVGAFIVNSGLSKLKGDQGTADYIHGTAKTAYPFLESQDPQKFTRTLGTAEVALGSALMAPFVPTVLAGAGLTGFAGALTGLYLRLPGMREKGSIRPTQEGTPLVKDTWLVGIGATLVLEELSRTNEKCRHHRRRR